ncbi:MAG: hypothetical protein M1827_007536 [Pycnora praestabilis]|nr:MAG: hypothetical protein M1827_007536 [Pycnora praestabilis]
MSLVPIITIVSLLVLFILFALVTLYWRRRTAQRGQRRQVQNTANGAPVRMLTVRGGRVVPALEQRTPSVSTKRSWIERTSWVSFQTTLRDTDKQSHRPSGSLITPKVLSQVETLEEESTWTAPTSRHTFSFEQKKQGMRSDEAREKEVIDREVCIDESSKIARGCYFISSTGSVESHSPICKGSGSKNLTTKPYPNYALSSQASEADKAAPHGWVGGIEMESYPTNVITVTTSDVGISGLPGSILPNSSAPLERSGQSKRPIYAAKYGSAYEPSLLPQYHTSYPSLYENSMAIDTTQPPTAILPQLDRRVEPTRDCAIPSTWETSSLQLPPAIRSRNSSVSTQPPTFTGSSISPSDAHTPHLSVASFDSNLKEFSHYYFPPSAEINKLRRPTVSRKSIGTLASIDSIVQPSLPVQAYPTMERKDKALPPIPLYQGALVHQSSNAVMKVSGTAQDLQREKAVKKAEAKKDRNLRKNASETSNIQLNHLRQHLEGLEPPFGTH